MSGGIGVIELWDYPFDPAETKDFDSDLSAEMTRTGDSIQDVDWTLPPAAVAAGLRVATSYVSNGVFAVVWFTAADPAALRAALSGTNVEVVRTVRTVGGRTLVDTVILKIRDKIAAAAA